MAKTKAQQAAIAISMKKASKKPKMEKGGSYENFIKDFNQSIKKQDYDAAKIYSDFLNNQVDNLRKVQKVYPESRSINKTKNLVNEEKVRANADKVRANAALYKSKKGGAVKKVTAKKVMVKSKKK
jgi:hypothetical protein